MLFSDPLVIYWLMSIKDAQLPSRRDINFPRLKSDDEFEELALDLCRLEWNDPYASDRHGRSGQGQDGVDIYGHPSDRNGANCGAQCKLRTGGKQPSEAEIEAEVQRARNFTPPLELLILITDAPRDVNTQKIVRAISEREQKAGRFEVTIWFWDSICQRIAARPSIIINYFHDLLTPLTTAAEAERLVDIPIYMLSTCIEASNVRTQLEEALELRGIQLCSPKRSSPGVDSEPDGVLFQYLRDDEIYLHRLAAQVLPHAGKSYPTYISLLTEQQPLFLQLFTDLGGHPEGLHLLNRSFPVNENARAILQQVFNYGYRRRGSLSTIDLSIRSDNTPPRSTLLDINWEAHDSPAHLPGESEWQFNLFPALEDVRRVVAQQGDRCLVQFRSVLQLPAALAVGYTFNIRLARLGVWARDTGVSDFRQQYWRSDGPAGDILLSQNWIQVPSPTARSVVVELANGRNIHASVEAYATQSNLNADAWLQIGHEKTDPRLLRIDEDCAVAYANQVGQIFRDIQQNGITDFHLFLCMPSALAILVGQRLQACGRIHLYWYTNPTYQYAFTLR